MEYTCIKCQKKFNSSEALEQHNKAAHAGDVISSKNLKSSYIIIGVIILAALLIGTYFISGPGGQYDDFAKCIADSGTKFYGAWWCPHCKEQKELFGTSEKYLPYIECSTPDGQSQLPICQDVGIQGYPTWIFADNTRSNQLGLKELSQKTNCPLP